MVRDERKNKIINVIVYSLLTIFIIITISLNYISYKKYNKEIEHNILLNKDLSQAKEIYEEKLANNNNLKKEIEQLNHIDDNIVNIKKEVFELAKQLEQKIKNNESNKKIAYLTFDDGPYYATHDFLAVLDKYKVKATFFTINANGEKCYDNKTKNCHELYKKIVDKGHTIANHTYYHSIFYGLYNSSNSLINQLKKQENLIKEKTNVTTNIFRFPGGSSSAKAYGVFNSAIVELRKMNYGWVDWTASNGDGLNIKDVNKALENFKNSINEDIEVVLFHDYSRVTLSMLPEAIEYLENNNYIILPLFYDSIMVNK